MKERVRTHLVGSLPFGHAGAAMQESLERLGGTLPYVPDGETGERANYIMHLVDRLARNPSLSSYEVTAPLGGESTRRVRFSIRRGRKLELELGALGYFRDWSASLPLFHKLREELGRPELRYQLGVAPALSIAFPFFRKPFSMLKALGPLQNALREEIGAAVQLEPNAVVVQLDAAIEQILIARLHALLPTAARILARRLARQLASLAVDVPPEVPVGVHLCLGNPGNRRAVTPSSSRPVVLFANAIAAVWPADRPLDYLHLPIVDSTDPRYYEPLEKLRLSGSTRLIVGTVYEDGHPANLERLRLASRSLGFTPDIACACGMGRRSAEVGRQLLDEMKALADDVS